MAFMPSFALGQSYVVYDFTHNKVLESQNAYNKQPIASVTKLMTANIFLEHNPHKNCRIAITDDDRDFIKGTHTKLPKNVPIACSELLKAMLVHSDNYAAHALSRATGMSRFQFIRKMNEKAKALGMQSTIFIDSSGLAEANQSSAMDLVKLAKYSMQKPQIKQLSNLSSTYIQTGRTPILMKNTNKLVRDEIFGAMLNKTGYISESGYNLVFVNRNPCHHAIIGVISLNNASAEARTAFTKRKLEKYGCRSVYHTEYSPATPVVEDGYNKEEMRDLLKQLGV